MKIIRNNIIPFKGFTAINICGMLFVRGDSTITDRVINHERIHTEQIKEFFCVGFYLLYFAEWIYKYFYIGKKAYRNLSFEKEAYNNENDQNYIKTRKHYAMWRNSVSN